MSTDQSELATLFSIASLVVPQVPGIVACSASANMHGYRSGITITASRAGKEWTVSLRVDRFVLSRGDQQVLADCMAKDFNHRFELLSQPTQPTLISAVREAAPAAAPAAPAPTPPESAPAHPPQP